MSRVAMSSCVFPEDIMLLILKRLPVKSLMRFKAVFKPWCHLFSTPKFIKNHHDQFSSDPKNQCVIMYGLTEDYDSTMFMFNLHLNKRKPTVLDHHPYFLSDLMGAANPYPHSDIIGCCNGLFCITRIVHGVMLWNPAMNLSKRVVLQDDYEGTPNWVSLGFGYDAVREDYKVVRIVSFKDMKGVRVEVYSVYEDKWEILEVDFQFGSVLVRKSDVIVNGTPYWVSKVGGSSEVFVLVRFDFADMDFKIVRLTEFDSGEEAKSEIGCLDWDGSLGALVFFKENDMVDSLRVWVYDDGDKVWKKIHTFKLNKMRVDCFLHCSKSGKILGRRVNGKLFVYDPHTKRVKAVQLYGVQPAPIEVYGYSESLAYVKGMEHVDEERLPYALYEE